MTPALASICSEFGIEVLYRGVRRGPMQTHAGAIMQRLIDDYGSAHLRLVVMTILETKNNANALAEPILYAVSDVILEHPSWPEIDPTKWFKAFDDVDLLDLWGRAKLGGVPRPRQTITALLIDKLSQIFPPEQRKRRYVDA
jgi:hypothetical protein